MNTQFMFIKMYFYCCFRILAVSAFDPLPPSAWRGGFGNLRLPELGRVVSVWKALTLIPSHKGRKTRLECELQVCHWCAV